jgi:hypothetical protein
VNKQYLIYGGVGVGGLVLFMILRNKTSTASETPVYDQSLGTLGYLASGGGASYAGSVLTDSTPSTSNVGQSAGSTLSDTLSTINATNSTHNQDTASGLFASLASVLAANNLGSFSGSIATDSTGKTSVTAGLGVQGGTPSQTGRIMTPAFSYAIPDISPATGTYAYPTEDPNSAIYKWEHNTRLDNGLTPNQNVARLQGFTGPFGGGADAAILAANPQLAHERDVALIQGYFASLTPDPSDDLKVYRG